MKTLINVKELQEAALYISDNNLALWPLSVSQAYKCLLVGCMNYNNIDSVDYLDFTRELGLVLQRQVQPDGNALIIFRFDCYENPETP